MIFLHVKPATISNFRRLDFDREGYINSITSILPAIEIDLKSDMRLECWFGISNMNGNDTDNLLKVFKDILAKFYGFSDHRVCSEHVYKVPAYEKCEFIAFELVNTGTDFFATKSQRFYNQKYRQDENYLEYQRDYQREWQRKKARERRRAKHEDQSEFQFE